MEHQQWEQTVLSKTKTSIQRPKEKTPSNSLSDAPPIPQALDINEKKIEWFTPAMGKRIAALRAEKKLTQEQFAQKMGMKKNDIADIEYGNKVKYQGQIVNKLKKVLGNFSW